MSKSIDLVTVPLYFIDRTVIRKPVEQIQEECAKLSKTYRRIKAAKHEDIY
jgi:hypothetical protein